MSGKTAIVVALALGLGMAMPPPGAALPAVGAVQQDGVNWHHQMRRNAMRDMAKVMAGMTQRMSSGALTAVERKQMAQRMRRMSTMMDLMAGWEDAPAMGEADMKEQMARMRAEMDQMMREMKIR